MRIDKPYKVHICKERPCLLQLYFSLTVIVLSITVGHFSPLPFALSISSRFGSDPLYARQNRYRNHDLDCVCVTSNYFIHYPVYVT